MLNFTSYFATFFYYILYSQFLSAETIVPVQFILLSISISNESIYTQYECRIFFPVDHSIVKSFSQLLFSLTYTFSKYLTTYVVLKNVTFLFNFVISSFGQLLYDRNEEVLRMRSNCDSKNVQFYFIV